MDEPKVTRPYFETDGYMIPFHAVAIVVPMSNSESIRVWVTSGKYTELKWKAAARFRDEYKRWMDNHNFRGKLLTELAATSIRHEATISDIETALEKICSAMDKVIETQTSMARAIPIESDPTGGLDVTLPDLGGPGEKVDAVSKTTIPVDPDISET